MPKITPEEIMELKEKGYTYKQIAKERGLTESYVAGVMYKHNHPEKYPQDPGNKNAEGAVHSKIEIANTGEVVSLRSINNAVGKLGDDKVNAFVSYHMEMFRMRQGVDKKNVPDLYNRFINYLSYCAAHNIVPNNMNAYFAIGVSKEDIGQWKLGVRGSAEQKKFAEDITAFFQSIHEQAPTEGLMNPISAMFWQKCHDGFIEASKIETEPVDQLGEKRTTEDILSKYDQIELPTD